MTCSMLEYLRYEFLRLYQGSMIVKEYEARFHELDWHVIIILPTKHDIVH